mgnify:CR=1 FL=1
MAYTTIDDPSAHFQIKLYSGNSTNNTAITNDGNSDLQPDWIWAKSRTNTHYHDLRDSTRGVTKRLVSNEADTESTKDQSYVSFDSDGFTLGDDTDSGGSALNTINTSSNNYVAWQWKANGGTTSSNSSGTNITSTVQANTTAGFSIVTFTGTGNDGDSYGHGLTSAPELVIPKRRDGTSNWQGYAFDGGNSQYWYLNLTNAFANTTGNSAASSSSVITTDASGDSNPSGGTVVSYCFHSVKGYSKIGRYSSNGNADGPFIYTGFKPAWVMIKRTDASQSWNINDTTRDPENPSDLRILADSGGAEEDRADTDAIDFLSNGFKIRSTATILNASGGTYIYMAFAEHPFVSSEGVPVTAR